MKNNFNLDVLINLLKSFPEKEPKETYSWNLQQFSTKNTQPKKLKYKLPMQQTVVDIEGNLFNYEIINNKVVYSYFATIFDFKNDKDESDK